MAKKAKNPVFASIEDFFAKFYFAYQNAILDINSRRAIPILYTVRMTSSERDLFDRTLKESANYLEFGMGGSTVRALLKSNAYVHAIDSSEGWIASMKRYKLLQDLDGKRCTLYFVNIGPTWKWGRPVNSDFRDLYPEYSSSIFNQIDKSKIDTVLVDGRFRVACALKTIIECHENKKLKILFHDFHRPEYQFILKYTNQVEKQNKLILLSIKEDINFDELRADYDLYKYNDD
jgi:hypothetical protein